MFVITQWIYDCNNFSVETGIFRQEFLGRYRYVREMWSGPVHIYNGTKWPSCTTIFFRQKGGDCGRLPVKRLCREVSLKFRSQQTVMK